MEKRPFDTILRQRTISETDPLWAHYTDLAHDSRMQLRAWVREAMAEKAARQAK